MNPISRAEATRHLTKVGKAWLYFNRGCRVIADEVGAASYDMSHFCSPIEGACRPDIVGVAQTRSRLSISFVYRFDVVEVKSTLADFKSDLKWVPHYAKKEELQRRRMAAQYKALVKLAPDMTPPYWLLHPRKMPPPKLHPKLEATQQSLNHVWLLVMSDFSETVMSLAPQHLGILDYERGTGRVRTLRKPSVGQTRGTDDPSLATDMFHLANRSVTRTLTMPSPALRGVWSAYHDIAVAEW